MVSETEQREPSSAFVALVARAQDDLRTLVYFNAAHPTGSEDDDALKPEDAAGDGQAAPAWTPGALGTLLTLDPVTIAKDSGRVVELFNAYRRESNRAQNFHPDVSADSIRVTAGYLGLVGDRRQLHRRNGMFPAVLLRLGSLAVVWQRSREWPVDAEGRHRVVFALGPLAVVALDGGRRDGQGAARSGQTRAASPGTAGVEAVAAPNAGNGAGRAAPEAAAGAGGVVGRGRPPPGEEGGGGESHGTVPRGLTEASAPMRSAEAEAELLAWRINRGRLLAVIIFALTLTLSIYATMGKQFLADLQRIENDLKAVTEQAQKDADIQRALAAITDVRLKESTVLIPLSHALWRLEKSAREANVRGWVADPCGKLFLVSEARAAWSAQSTDRTITLQPVSNPLRKVDASPNLHNGPTNLFLVLEPQDTKLASGYAWTARVRDERGKSDEIRTYAIEARVFPNERIRDFCFAYETLDAQRKAAYDAIDGWMRPARAVAVLLPTVLFQDVPRVVFNDLPRFLVHDLPTGIGDLLARAGGEVAAWLKRPSAAASSVADPLSDAKSADADANTPHVRSGNDAARGPAPPNQVQADRPPNWLAFHVYPQATLAALSTFLLPALYGALGGWMAAERSLRGRLQSFALTRTEGRLFLRRILLGAVVGGMIGVLLSGLKLFGDGKLWAALEISALALLFGFAGDRLFSLFDNLLRRMIGPATAAR
ncbi:hypothetical protein [Elioraea thermophila]|uniref:hypothetical protein n=1 Tax=Elioraea thermophila TaxID=2185104 RepID=UPI0013009637|nr:hypothetical protein [Elioraea thermophila]